MAQLNGNLILPVRPLFKLFLMTNLHNTWILTLIFDIEAFEQTALSKTTLII